MSVKPGQSLGQYQIVEQIGKGGMATVYRASQKSLSRQVAVKVLPEFFAEDPAFHERFRQEAMAVANLRHSNILTVFDSGEQEGIAYIVAELVDGGTLADRLGKPLPPEDCVNVIKPIASALDYAHSKGVIHRDVKPGNILLTREGTPILTDFGLARMMGAADIDATRITMAGATVGTPTYMAPEQAGNSAVGAPADVYSLAVILYEMLTGTVPYSGDSALSVIVARLSQPLPPPRERNPNLSEAVSNVLVKGLAKDPAERYVSAGEMIRALELAIQPGPAIAAPAAAVQPHKSNKAILVVAGVLALATLAAIVIVPRLRSASPATALEAKANPTASNTVNSAPNAAQVQTGSTPVAAAIPVRTDEAAPRNESNTNNNDGLPPHGRLLYSTKSNATEFAATALQKQEDKITVAPDGTLEFSTLDFAGSLIALPVEGVRDFVAVLRYATLSGKPLFRIRFHSAASGSGSQFLVMPLYQKLSPPAAGAPADVPHSCCRDFDMYTTPAPGQPNFTGVQPVSVPAAADEEQVLVITAKGPLITVYSGGREIARATSPFLEPGKVSIQIQNNAAGTQMPALVRLHVLELYDAPGGPASKSPAIVAHGKLLYSLAGDVADIASQKQQNAGDTMTVKGSAIDMTMVDSTGLFVNFPVNGLADFVEVLHYATISKTPSLQLRLRKNGPKDLAIQFPAFQHFYPAAAETHPMGTHNCCQNFDMFIAPWSSASPAVYTGATPLSVAAGPNEDLELTVSLKGPQIILYSGGLEIGRASESSLVAGGIGLHVMPQGKPDQPMVLRINSLEIYEQPAATK